MEGLLRDNQDFHRFLRNPLSNQFMGCTDHEITFQVEAPRIEDGFGDGRVVAAVLDDATELHARAILEAQGLQQPPFDLGRHHELTVPKRDFEIGEREITIIRRHIKLAAYGRQRFEHARVQHLPGAHLLAHHLQSREVRVHGSRSPGGGQKTIAKGTEFSGARQGAV